MKHFCKGEKNSMRKQNLKAITQAWAWASLPVLWLLTLLLGQTHHPDLWGWQPLNPDSVFAALMHYTFPPVVCRSGCSPFGAWLCLNMSVLWKQCKHSSVASVTQRQHQIQPAPWVEADAGLSAGQTWTQKGSFWQQCSGTLNHPCLSSRIFSFLDVVTLCRCAQVSRVSLRSQLMYLCVLLVCVCMSELSQDEKRVIVSSYS